MEHIRVTKVPGVKAEKGRKSYFGTLHLLAHHILFCPEKVDTEIWISYSTIQSVDRKEPTRHGLHPLCITCRNFAYLKLFVPHDRDATDVFASLQKLMNIACLEQLYAFSYQPVKPYSQPARWRRYDTKKEFMRQGMGTKTDQWRFTSVNEDYEFCPTYPRIMVVPSKISDNVLRYTSKFRSKGRIPTLSYLHRSNMVSITRSSQPMVGLKQNRSIQDEKLVEAMFASAPHAECAGSNLIIDARPTANAMAQTALGAGTESTDNYKGCKIVYLGIDNIHVVRDSMLKVMEAMSSVESGPVPQALLHKTGWLKHIRHILDGAFTIVRDVHLHNSHVLVHCSDGWDRTAQLCSLAEICLDPYFRTIEGLAVLIEKEWVSFGHKFQDRCGHLSRDPSQSSDRNSVGAQFQAARRNVSNSITSAAKSFLSKNQINIGGLSFGSAGHSPLGETQLSRPGSGGNSNFGRSSTSGTARMFSADSSSELPQPQPPSAAQQLNSVDIAVPNHVAPREVSPVFTQFLDCVYQLWTQFPTHFQYSERLLSFLHLHVYACQFGNFLFNCEREQNNYRAPGNRPIEEATFSIWDHIDGNIDEFLNPHYVSPEERADQAPIGAGGGTGSSNPSIPGTPGSVSDDGQILYPSTANLKYWAGLCLREEDIKVGGDLVDTELRLEDIDAFTDPSFDDAAEATVQSSIVVPDSSSIAIETSVLSSLAVDGAVPLSPIRNAAPQEARLVIEPGVDTEPPADMTGEETEQVVLTSKNAPGEQVELLADAIRSELELDPGHAVSNHDDGGDKAAATKAPTPLPELPEEPPKPPAKDLPHPLWDPLTGYRGMMSCYRSTPFDTGSITIYYAYMTVQIRTAAASEQSEDAQDVDSQVRDLKRELKEWERAFAAKAGRKPEKPDILADKTIAKRYKTYIKLKNTVEGGGKDASESGSARSSVVKIARSRAPADNNEVNDGAKSDDEEPAPKPPKKALDATRKGSRLAQAQSAESTVDDDDNTPEQPAQREAAAPRKSSMANKAVYFEETVVSSLEPNVSPISDVRNSDTSSVSTANAAEARPWGANAALPDNFKLRNTIASGPISTATLSVERPSTAGRERGSTVGENSRPDVSGARPASSAGRDASEDDAEMSEFVDFMNRKKELETLTAAKPAGAVSAAAALSRLLAQHTNSRPSSASGEPRLVTPIITSITVQAPKPPVTPHSALPTSPPPEPLTAAQLRELSKPYDPTASQDDDDAEPDTPLHAVPQRTAPRKGSDSKSPVPPVRGKLAFTDPSEPTEDVKPSKAVDETPKPPERTSRKGSAKAEPKPPQPPAEDEEEEDERDVIAPLAPAANATQTMCFGADAIGVATNPSIIGVKIFYRIPPEYILRCKLYRKKNLLDKAHPTFFLYNQADESFLLAARKRKKSKSVNYVISTSQLDMSKDSKHYVAKLKANFQRTNFLLHDARSYNPKSDNKGFKELACFSYLTDQIPPQTKTVLPREMSIAIPSPKIPELSEHYSKDIMADVKSQNTEKLCFLRNKPPRWNEATQSHCLNFGGRVTQPSIKNFQLIGPENENFVVMQFGRCGPDYFTLDARYPMTPLEAFAVALTTFDAYDNA
ncbi:uncharacterized protein EV422DRAFT_503282 [Fimicolochytrium jonesii]|uniref:uncharacterized protein n=1 Tax=Fimicolochytrium jonesii TaxID=1396493 RepID=UPI0022FDFC8D|nr:uncharacterized protein EV422DRAFT_503282 [Fimicolochytrium jonesii]KAI8825933.1 hypothetical protein EV422DRAFT_503282 [Fimicolochytrium jonesii]